jgi:hypothetical protein
MIASQELLTEVKIKKCVKVLVCENKERDCLVDNGVDGNKTYMKQLTGKR